VWTAAGGRVARRRREAGGKVCGSVHGRRRMGTRGIDARQLGGMDPEDVRQHGREMRPQVEAIGPWARHGSPEACPLCRRLGPIPHEPLTPGMRLPPPGDGAGLAIGEQSQGPPPCEGQQEGAVGVTLAQGALVHAEDVRGADRRAWGAADHPQERVLPDRESAVAAQPHPGRSTQGEAHGEEACR
jgi:hypothetical protein